MSTNTTTTTATMQNYTTISMSNVASETVTIVDFDFDGNGAEMGFFFLCSLLGVFLLMNQLNGRIFRMKIFLMNRDFNLVRNPKIIQGITLFVRVMSWFFLLLPLFSLLVWAAGLIAHAVYAEERPTGGICVFFVGAALFCLLSNFFRLKWNNFTYDWRNGVFFALTFVFLTCYQFVAVFVPRQKTVFGVNVVFLAANCLVMMAIVFFNSAVMNGSIDDLIKNKITSQGGPQRDPNREKDFDQEINEEKLNKDYIPSQGDIFDIFTIGKPEYRPRFVGTSFGPGLQNFFGTLNPLTKRITTILLWCLATGILVVYSFMIKKFFPEKGDLGFITMIAILTTDVLIYLVQNAEIVKTATPLCLTLFLNRFLLIIFGGDYWVYGYIAIYLFYGLLLSVIIAKRRFPLEDENKNFNIEQLVDDIRNKKAELEGKAPIAKAATAQGGSQAIMNNAMNKLNAVEDKIQDKFKLLSQPEHPLFIISIIYLIILGILALVKPKRVPLPRLPVYSGDLHFIVAWAYSIVIICALFTSIAVVRLFMRRKMGGSQRVFYTFKNCCAQKTMRIDRYWVFIVLNLISLVGIGIISWSLTSSWTSCVLVIFVDLYMLTIMNFYSHYISNDYNILQNIDDVNIRVKQHNQRLDNLSKEIKDVQQKLISGDGHKAIGKDLMERAMTMVVKKDPAPQPPAQQANQWGNTSQNMPQTASSSSGNNGGSTSGGAKVNVRVLPEKNPTENDQLIEEEMNQMKGDNKKKPPAKAAASDGIYEGGEEEAKGNEVTEIFVDPDEEEVVDAKKTRVKYLEIKDWRKSTNFFAAFWKGSLRKNDYQIIFSQILGFIVLIIGAWLICRDQQSYVGITIFVPFAHYTIAAYSHMKTLSTDSPMNIFEYICFVFAYVIQYGWGIANLYLTYGFFRPKGTVTIYDKGDSGLYIVVNLIVIPFITSGIAAILKWIDNKGKLSRFLIGQLVITLIQGIAMLVCAFVYMTWIQGVVISGIIGMLVYVGFQVWIYTKNEYYMPKLWLFINIGIVVLAIIAAFVVSLATPGFTIFLGFSISMWLLCLLLFIFGFGRVLFDYINLRKRPVFFSPWVFPIFSYDIKKQDIIKQNFPAGCLIASFTIMVGWSVLATVWFTPTHAGVALSILFEMLLILSIVFLVQISHLQLKKVSTLVDNKIIRRAWIEAKQTYVGNRNAPCRADLVTYEDYIARRNIFRNKMRLLEGRQTLSFEEQFEGVKLLPSVNESDMSQWLNTKVVNFQQPLTCYQYIFELENDITNAYNMELELIIMFQILIIQYTEIYADQKKKYLFNFLHEKRPVLLALDIVINIPPNSSTNIQYAKVINQIKELPQNKQEMFFDLREQFVQEQRAIDDKRREAAQAEENKSNDRQRDIADQQKKKKDNIKDNHDGKPVAQWVDCWEKYARILEDFRKTGQKFTDSQFTADQKGLGEKCQSRGVDLWIRASQHPDKKCVLFKDKVSALDVKQGALGDCYFLSAISVLGDQNVVEMIKTKEDDWAKTGCFCVRFFQDGEEEFVIVDDYFPARKVDGKIEWAFVSGGDGGDELWPMVLEKAYAKLYGDYSKIEAGKVHYALADMVKGFPEQIDLKKDAKNLEVFWEKMKALKRQGALIGAGSPENPLGDSAINQLGIVQGHAYSILNIDEIDDAKLVMMRNPHGAGGAEWQGDWSDTSANWNQRAKNKLKYEPRDHEDGVFWMDAYDFLQQFSYLYICRILNASTGWKEVEMAGQWLGESAEGLPGRANPSARLELNPHFSITVTKPCDSFILLKQMDTDPQSIFKGKQSIFFMVSKNDGQVIKKLDKDAIVCRSGNPINLLTISAECIFDKTVSYPYTFSMLVANTNHGPEGEGKFEVRLYSTDMAMEVKPLA